MLLGGLLIVEVCFQDCRRSKMLLENLPRDLLSGKKMSEKAVLSGEERETCASIATSFELRPDSLRPSSEACSLRFSTPIACRLPSSPPSFRPPSSRLRFGCVCVFYAQRERTTSTSSPPRPSRLPEKAPAVSRRRNCRAT